MCPSTIKPAKILRMPPEELVEILFGFYVPEESD